VKIDRARNALSCRDERHPISEATERVAGLRLSGARFDTLAHARGQLAAAHVTALAGRGVLTAFAGD